MRKRTYLIWKKLLTRLCILLLIVGAFYAYFRTGFFTIHTYVIKGEPDGYEDALQSGLRAIADEKIFKILPGNRTVSFHHGKIASFVKKTLPNTKSLSVYPSGLHTLTITLSSYTPSFRLAEGQAIADDGTRYHEISLHTELPLLTLATTTQLSGAQIASLATLSTNITTVLFPVRAITVDEYGDARLVDERSSSSVITNIDSDMKKIWSNILSAIDTEPLKGKLAHGADHLLYLDARFGNKVFYKFTSGASSDIIPKTDATSTATTTIQ